VTGEAARTLDGGGVLRPAGPDDTAALVRLLATVFPDNPKADPDVLRWQFWDDPFGRAASWVIEDGGELVCHFAVLPVPARLGGRRITAAKPADAATLPSHRGRGLMGLAARAVSAECRERGIPVTICLPNLRARGALEKIGMREVGRVRAYVAPLDDAWLAQRFRLPTAAARLARRTAFRLGGPGAACQVPAPPDDVDHLWAHTAQEVPNGIAHDAAWWRWRYVDRPDAEYRFHELRAAGRLQAVAASVVRRAYGGPFLHLLDLQARHGDAARQVVGAAARDAGGAVGVATIGLPGTRAAQLAEAAGLRLLPRRLEPQEQVLGLLHNDPDLGDLSDRAWSVSWTDLDHL
jgi:RimJ/RimL family protein N-acetyltransferase